MTAADLEVIDPRLFELAPPAASGESVRPVDHAVLPEMSSGVGGCDAGPVIAWGRGATVGVVGNEEGAHDVGAGPFQRLGDVGFTVPAGGRASSAVTAANVPHAARFVNAEPYPLA